MHENTNVKCVTFIFRDGHKTVEMNKCGKKCRYFLPALIFFFKKFPLKFQPAKKLKQWCRR